jgi:hypothetical protein
MRTQNELAHHHFTTKRDNRTLTCFFHFGIYLAGITIVGKTARHTKSATNDRDIAADGSEHAEKLKRTPVLLPVREPVT